MAELSLPKIIIEGDYNEICLLLRRLQFEADKNLEFNKSSKTSITLFDDFYNSIKATIINERV